jgi:hypothetical protein
MAARASHASPPPLGFVPPPATSATPTASSAAGVEGGQVVVTSCGCGCGAPVPSDLRKYAEEAEWPRPRYAAHAAWRCTPSIEWLLHKHPQSRSTPLPASTPPQPPSQLGHPNSPVNSENEDRPQASVVCGAASVVCGAAVGSGVGSGAPSPAIVRGVAGAGKGGDAPEQWSVAFDPVKNAHVYSTARVQDGVYPFVWRQGGPTSGLQLVHCSCGCGAPVPVSHEGVTTTAATTTSTTTATTSPHPNDPATPTEGAAAEGAAAISMSGGIVAEKAKAEEMDSRQGGGGGPEEDSSLVGGGGPKEDSSLVPLARIREVLARSEYVTREEAKIDTLHIELCRKVASTLSPLPSSLLSLSLPSLVHSSVSSSLFSSSRQGGSCGSGGVHYRHTDTVRSKPRSKSPAGGGGWTGWYCQGQCPC